jgi:MFS family permease
MSHRTENFDGPGRLSAPSRRAILGPTLASIAFVLELTLVPLLLPVIQHQFNLSISELGWVFNSYGLAVAIGVLLGGWFSDTFGTRTIFSIGAACFASGSFLVAFAGSYEMLIFGRTLQGFGGGVFSPLIPLLLTRASPRRPGWILIVWGSVTGYVAAIAPLTYGQFLRNESWGLAFIFIGLLAVGAASALIGSRAAESGEPSSAQAADYSELLRSRNLWVMFCYVFCTYGAITYFLFRLPVWLTYNEFDTVSLGVVISTFWLSFATLSTLLRNKVDRSRVHQIMLAAPVLIAVGLSLSFQGEPLLVILASILIGSGLACSNAPSTQMILKFAPKGMSAVSTSLDITFARLGGVVTVMILAPIEIAFSIPALIALCVVACQCALIAIRGNVLDDATENPSL